MLETPCLRPLPKIDQTHDGPLGVAIPKTPLRAVDFCQCMDAGSTIGNGGYALRDLLEVFESHRDVEPVQYMVGMWRNLLMNGPQTGIAIGKNCDRRGFVGSAMLQRKIDRTDGLRTSVSYKGKTCRLPIAIQRFAGNDLKVSFRPSVSISNVSTIEADNQFFAGIFRGRLARASADFPSRLPTFIVRLRTVLAVDCADKGRNSPRKSAAFLNGTRQPSWP